MGLLDLFRRKPAARAFEAGKVTRLTHSWRPSAVSLNTDLRLSLTQLQARSRDLFHNNDYARKFGKMVQANIVGPAGFVLQSRAAENGKPDKLDADAIETHFAAWSRAGVCEVTGRQSFREFCATQILATARDGEYLVRNVRDAANPYGFRLQGLDPTRLDASYNLAATPGRNAIVMGVEIDPYGKPVAYHILSQAPDDTGQRVRERVPADLVYHGFISESPEQVRGVPWMHAAILTLHQLGEFEQSALTAARKGADTLGFFVSPDGTPPPVGDATGADDEPISVSVPGTYDTLPEGYDFKAYDSRYPDAMLADFAKHYLRRAASGLNVAYNGLANDLEGVNFSSIRSGTLDEREQWMTIQAWFAESLLTRVYEDWLDAALLRGAITTPTGKPLPASKRYKYLPHVWQGRRWSWVDPLKDIEASIQAIDAGLASPYRIAAQQGLDVEDVLDDIARFQALAAEKKVSLGRQKAAAPIEPTGDAA